MDKSKLELLNLANDLKRSVMFLVRSKDNNPKSCIFTKNILSNYSKFIKIDPEISKIIDIEYIKNSKDAAKTKAEYLLMQSLSLQHYLGL